MNRRKDSGNFFVKLGKSFCHGLDGINYAIEREGNTLIMMIISVLLLILGLLLKISLIELSIIIIIIGINFIAEMFNSSLEAVADSVTLEDNKLIKICKDCATSSILVSVFIEVVVSGIIFIPKIIALL